MKTDTKIMHPISTLIQEWARIAQDQAYGEFEFTDFDSKCNHEWKVDKYFSAREFITCSKCNIKKEDA